MFHNHNRQLVSRRNLLLSMSVVPAQLMASRVCDKMDANNPPGMEGFVCEPRTAAGRTHDLYSIGSGPAVFVCHELPGLYRADIDLARLIAANGFTAYVPLFFGKPDECHPNSRAVEYFFKPWGELSLWASKTPRAARWLLPQLKYAREKSSGKGVAVIGMCMTGSLPLAVMSSPDLKAAVLCQPTNPLFPHSSIDLSESDRQMAAAGTVDVLGLRFSEDHLSPAARWKTLKCMLGDRMTELIINSKDGNKHRVPHDAHSILAGSYDRTAHSPTAAAFELVIRFIDSRISVNPRHEPYPKAGEPLPPGFDGPEKFVCG